MFHSFDTFVAVEYGLVEAILVHNFQFWIEKNRANEKHRYDGRTWTYNSVRAFAVVFPYLGKKQIYNALKRLETAGVLLTGSYSSDHRDHTTWYAFVDEARWLTPTQKGKSKIIPKGKSPIIPEGKSSITDDKTLTDSNPDALLARVPAGMYIVDIEGVCVGPEKPEIPTIPKIPVPGAPPEKVEKPESRRNSAPDRDWQRWVNRYETHVKANNGDIGHHWTKAQLGPAGLKGIRAHLVKVSTKDPGYTDEDCGFHAWCYVLDHWAELGDEWLQKQFDLCVILKKITDILNRLKNAANTNRGAGTSGNGKLSASQARNEALRDY